MQRCHRASGTYSAALSSAAAGIGNDQPYALEAAVDKVPQKREPAEFVFLGALADAQNLPKALRIDRARHQQCDIADFAGPSAPHRCHRDRDTAVVGDDDVLVGFGILLLRIKKPRQTSRRGLRFHALIRRSGQEVLVHTDADRPHVRVRLDVGRRAQRERRTRRDDARRFSEALSMWS